MVGHLLVLLFYLTLEMIPFSTKNKSSTRGKGLNECLTEWWVSSVDDGYFVSAIVFTHHIPKRQIVELVGCPAAGGGGGGGWIVVVFGGVGVVGSGGGGACWLIGGDGACLGGGGFSSGCSKSTPLSMCRSQYHKIIVSSLYTPLYSTNMT